MLPSQPTEETGNQLLDRLPASERDRLLEAAERISLPGTTEIYRQDGAMTHIYFPVSAICSVVILLREGRQVETATTGSEGMVGATVHLGLDFSLSSVVVQVSGELLRLPVDRFQQVARPGSAIVQMLERYLAYQLREASQRLACNTHHSVEERTCRWLLTAQDRSGREEFQLTHEYLSEMIGTRRQTVTVIARMLQEAGRIRYRRGIVRILQHEALEACSCECYEVLRAIYQRVMDYPLSA